MNQPIAMQSYCYRHFKSLPAFFEQLKSTGVAATEVCRLHANFDDVSQFRGIIEQYRNAGIQIVAIGVEKMTGDVNLDRPRMEFCKQAGIQNMSITFDPATFFEGKLKSVEALADEYDLKLGIHNHGGYDWLGNSVILQYVFSKTSQRFGLHIDTAWAIDAKQNPVEMIERFADRLFGVHVKDFVYDPKRNPKDVVIGKGILDLPKFMGVLKQQNFSGPLVIEYEGDVENPVPALKECVAELMKLM